MHNQKRHGDKFADRSIPGIFIGYPPSQKGWRVYCPDTGNIIVSRDVIFSETVFPFSQVTAKDTETSPPTLTDPFPAEEEVAKEHGRPPITTNEDGSSRAADPVAQPADGGSRAADSVRPTGSGAAGPSATGFTPATGPAGGADEPVPGVEPRVAASIPIEPELEQGRGRRTRTPSVRLADYVTYTVVGAPETTCKYPIATYVGYEKFSPAHKCYLTSLDTDVEPRNFRQACHSESWRKAMRAEIDALEKNGTWTLVPAPRHKKPLGSKWVYKIKRKSDGSIERYKARLVIFGNHQVEGIDYNETFAPVVKLTTVRTLLAVAAARSWELHQMDVHNALLHGDLDEEVYMRLPPGFTASRPDVVCRLKKSLYGLRQAPRCWFAKLSGALKKYGFQQSVSHYSLFSLRGNPGVVHVLVYVDDLVIAGDNTTLIAKLKSYLASCFHMKDLGSLKYFLGIEVARSFLGIFLC